MTTDKLKQIIARKNEQLEQRAVDRAREIIDQIADLQEAKITAENEIASLRSELAKLEIQKLDETSILGG